MNVSKGFHRNNYNTNEAIKIKKKPLLNHCTPSMSNTLATPVANEGGHLPHG